MLCALIMAGGKGTRFWPLSTEKKPKQFLNLLGQDTMIQMAVKRLLPIIPMERIFVVTSKEYVPILKEQLPNINKENIIVEPIGRNTAPCIALSAFHINKRYKDATMIVVPSDHLIKKEDEFLEVLKEGEKFIEEHKDAIATIGIEPTRAETGYGYIKYDKELNDKIVKVERFVEKPNLEKAEKYFKSGEYLWNSGMFMWKAENILKLVNRYLKNTYDILQEIINTKEEGYEESLQKNYPKVDNISVDFAIMEKTQNIYVIKADLAWDDVGSWKSIERYREKDEDNNITLGSVKTLEGKNNIIIGNKKPIVLSGVEDIVLVESDDMIFLGKKENIENLCKVRDLLEL